MNFGSESSRLAATTTWFTALTNSSPAISPAAPGSAGRLGYSLASRVGSVNFEVPALTMTRVPSNVNVIEELGSERTISARSCPLTKTVPFSIMFALRTASVDVSRFDPVSLISLPTSILIPSRAVIMGRAERLRATQLTASIRGSRSTLNFIDPSSFTS